MLWSALNFFWGFIGKKLSGQFIQPPSQSARKFHAFKRRRNETLGDFQLKYDIVRNFISKNCLKFYLENIIIILFLEQSP